MHWLPLVEFLPPSQMLPLGTEGRSQAFLEQARDVITYALQDAFDEQERAPWVVQFFCQDEDDSEAWLA
ncbi:hypothetical protein, partial [Dryocola clanedunensis]